MTGKFLISNNIQISKLDDHGILVKFLKDFDQNLGGQLQYLSTKLQDLTQLLVMKWRLKVKQEF